MVNVKQLNAQNQCSKISLSGLNVFCLLLIFMINISLPQSFYCQPV